MASPGHMTPVLMCLRLPAVFVLPTPRFSIIAHKAPVRSPVYCTVLTDSRMATASRFMATIVGTSALVRTVGAAGFDPLPYVNPLIGTSNGGNVFAGASLPYGMAKAVADTNSSSNQGGFTLDGSPVTGFSVLHDSGTGGSPSLGETNRPRSVPACVF